MTDTVLPGPISCRFLYTPNNIPVIEWMWKMANSGEEIYVYLKYKILRRDDNTTTTVYSGYMNTTDEIMYTVNVSYGMLETGRTYTFYVTAVNGDYESKPCMTTFFLNQTGTGVNKIVKIGHIFILPPTRVYSPL